MRYLRKEETSLSLFKAILVLALLGLLIAFAVSEINLKNSLLEDIKNNKEIRMSQLELLGYRDKTELMLLMQQVGYNKLRLDN